MGRSSAGVRLEWRGKAKEPTLPETELSLVRRGHPSTMLVHGDNLLALDALRRRAASQVTLAYLDPPFFTGRQHDKVTRTRDRSTGKILRALSPAFDDRWTGLEHYLSALAARVRAARELLAPNGCLVLHVDPKTSHYAKVLCDEIFGPDAFASEIVWRYRRWPSKTKNFQRVHDVLLRYVKDPAVEPRFRQLYEPLAESTQRTWGDRKQRAVVDSDGRRARSSTTSEASLGAPLGDVWEIGIVAPVAKERTGYPTQKPEALMSRLVEACTEPGDLVLDPYAGSGTTVAVCARLGRRVIGVDQNADALKIARKRLRELKTKPLEERVTAVKSTSGRRMRRAS